MQMIALRYNQGCGLAKLLTASTLLRATALRGQQPLGTAQLTALAFPVPQAVGAQQKGAAPGDGAFSRGNGKALGKKSTAARWNYPSMYYRHHSFLWHRTEATLAIAHQTSTSSLQNFILPWMSSILPISDSRTTEKQHIRKSHL